jgi:hypothetical protein
MWPDGRGGQRPPDPKIFGDRLFSDSDPVHRIFFAQAAKGTKLGPESGLAPGGDRGRTIGRAAVLSLDLTGDIGGPMIGFIIRAAVFHSA